MYVLGTDAEFEKCLPDTLKEEDPVPNDLGNIRNYSNDKHDRGGATMDGIIQREYDRFRKGLKLHTQDVRRISADEVRTIYHDEYWLPVASRLPIGIDLCVFDTAVNNGEYAAVKLLQRALGIHVDGQFGHETHAAVVTQSLQMNELISRFCAQRESYYRKIPEYIYFGKDWSERNARIKKEAQELIS